MIWFQVVVFNSNTVLENMTQPFLKFYNDFFWDTQYIMENQTNRFSTNCSFPFVPMPHFSRGREKREMAKTLPIFLGDKNKLVIACNLYINLISNSSTAGYVQIFQFLTILTNNSKTLILTIIC